MIVDVDHREYRIPSETITRKPPEENKRLETDGLKPRIIVCIKSLCFFGMYQFWFVQEFF